jgi:outer membrane protein assembly factor BamB
MEEGPPRRSTTGAARGDGYYIVVSRSRSTTYWVILALVALLSSAVFGQRPKRTPVPWIDPILPAEASWTLTLPTVPTAGGAMDTERVYIPLARPIALGGDAPSGDSADAQIVALDRETGLQRWAAPIASDWPPLVAGDEVYVAAANGIVALEATTGRQRWSLGIGAAPRAPMLHRRALLVTLTEPGELVGVRTDTRAIAWRRPLPDSAGARLIADDEAVYVATSTGSLTRVMLEDGEIDWTAEPERGAANRAFSEPAVARDRVFVGSTSNSFFAIDPESGDVRWKYDYRHIGGDAIGAAADADVVYVAALDNILRAMNRSDGNQKWKRNIGTRPVLPPVVLRGVVVVAGLNPLLSTFNAKTGAPIGTWAAPANAEPQGPPLIDSMVRPFHTAIVVILKDGRVIALRPTAMLFREPPTVPLTALPGRQLSREPSPTR